jgi:hypothetical protein
MKGFNTETNLFQYPDKNNLIPEIKVFLFLRPLN